MLGDGIHRRILIARFGGALLIGLAGLLIVEKDVSIEYWLVSFLVAIHLDVIYSYIMKNNMWPPFGVLLEYCEENKKERFRMMLLFSCGLPLVVYLWITTAF